MAGEVYKVVLPNGMEVRPAEWTAAAPLYSSVEIHSGALPAQLRAFSYGLGQPVPGSGTQRKSTLADTNLRGAGGILPKTEEYILFNMSIEFDLFGFSLGHYQRVGIDYHGSTPDTNLDLLIVYRGPFVPLEDVLRIQRDLVVSLVVSNQKELVQGPVSLFPGGPGVLGWANETHAIWSESMYSLRVNGTNEKIPPFGEINASGNGGPATWDFRDWASVIHLEGGKPFYVEFSAGPGRIEGLMLLDEFLARENVIDADLLPVDIRSEFTSGRLRSRIRVRVFLNGLRKRPVVG